MASPTISFVIPAYNCAPYIRRTLDSLFRQGVEDIEVIIVDDCSTDDTREIVEQYAGSEPRIRLVAHDVNRNLGAARNTGMRQAKGDFVFFIDSDDWLNDGGVGNLLKVARSRSADVVACGVQMVTEAGLVTPYHAWSFESSGGKEGVEYFSKWMIGSIVWNKLYRRSFLEEHNPRFVEGVYHEDVIFTAMTALRCKRYVSIEDVYVNYFQHGQSIINARPKRLHLASYLNLYLEMSKYFELLDKEGISDPALLRRLTRNYGALEVFPKLERYAATRTREQFVADVFDVTYELMGPKVLGIADAICAFFERHAQDD
jgi:glycosyltransferase involved in cell wall biosynthesis